MGILSSLFGNKDTANELVTGAANGIDKLYFSAEEKSDASSRAADWLIRYYDATNPQNIARRVIAFIIVGLWASLIVAAVSLYKIDLEYSEYIFRVLRDLVAVPFGLVISFYFATQLVRTWTGVKK